MEPRGLRFDDARRFFAAVRPIGERREVENSLFLGVAKRLASSGGEAFMIALQSGAELLAAALRTPPYDLSICAGSRTNIERLADAVIETGEPMPAVIGLEGAAGWFADRYRGGLGLRQKTRLRLTLYTLAAVIPPAVRAPGELRVATQSDRNWLID